MWNRRIDAFDVIFFVVDIDLIMASNRRCKNDQLPSLRSNRYFLITMTNFPWLLNRSARRHPPHAFQQSVTAELQAGHIASREALLYNTLKYRLEQALRSYLEQTEQMRPISLIVDMTDMQLSR